MRICIWTTLQQVPFISTPQQQRVTAVAQNVDRILLQLATSPFRNHTQVMSQSKTKTLNGTEELVLLNEVVKTVTDKFHPMTVICLRLFC